MHSCAEEKLGHHLKIKKSYIINFLLYIVFIIISLGLPNIAAEYLKDIGISFYHIVSTNTLIAVIAYLYIIRGLKQQWFNELYNRYVFIILLMLVPILLSGLNAYNVKLGLLYTRNYLGYYLLTILILWRLKTKENVLSFLKIFSLIGTIFAIATLLSSDISEIYTEMQAYEAGMYLASKLGPFDINVNTLGYIFVILFIVDISLLQPKSRWNLFLIASAILNLYLIFMTFSRGIFLALIVGIAVYLFLTAKSFKPYLYVSISSLLIYFIFSEYYRIFIERFATLKNWLTGDYIDLSIAIRVANFKESLNIGIKHFFLGIGGGNLNDFLEMGTHNQFLNMFVENGIFAFITYLLFILMITTGTLSIARSFKNNSGYKRNISACLAAIMCASLIQGVVSYLRYDFWVICSVSIAWILIVKKQARVSNQMGNLDSQ